MNVSTVVRNLKTNGFRSLIRLYSEGSTKYEKSLNSVQLIGRIGGEPLKRGSEDHPVVIFSLATNFSYKDIDGEFKQKTDWHRICVFKPNLRDAVHNYLRKGQRVFVTGKVSYGEIQDESGTKTVTSIIADDVIFFQT